MSFDQDQLVAVRSNLRGVIDDVAAISPLLGRELKLAMRQAGEVVLAEQRRILATERVGQVVVSRTYSAARPNARGGVRSRNMRSLAGARLMSVETRDAARSYSKGLRANASQNLKTAVTAPKSGRGAGVKVQSSTPQWYNKALNRKYWKSMVFPRPGRPAHWQMQAGSGYFDRGAAAGVQQAQEDLFALVQQAQDLIRDHKVT